MHRTFIEYIEPVMSNMDENTKNHLMYRFYYIYKLNPKNMFRMVSHKTKTDRVRIFYYCVSQLYNQKIDGVHVIANAGQGENFTRLVNRASKVPMLSVNDMRDVLTDLTGFSRVFTNFASPEIPKQTFGSFMRNMTGRHR